jgi:nucleotide-binding universal stress UspA family protein
MFTSVIVGVDGRAGGRAAITVGGLLSSPDARMTLAHVYGTDWPHADAGRGSLTAQRRESEALLKHERRLAGITAELVATASPTVARGLHELVDRVRADLLVLGSCHHGRVGRVMLGEDTKAALFGATSAVTVAPHGYRPPHTLTRIGVAHDGSVEAARCLAVARELARMHRASISALSVVPMDSVRRGTPISRDWSKVAGRLVGAEARRLNKLPDVDGNAVCGEPGEELARFSDSVDLLIVGSRGYGPLGRLMNGSTTRYLARNAACSLLVTPRGSEARLPEQQLGPHVTSSY